MAKKPDCFKAFIAVTHLIVGLSKAHDAAGNKKWKHAKWWLADAAHGAMFLERASSGKLKKTAGNLFRETSKLSKAKDPKVVNIKELRIKAKELRTQARAGCKSPNA